MTVIEHKFSKDDLSQLIAQHAIKALGLTAGNYTIHVDWILSEDDVRAEVRVSSNSQEEEDDGKRTEG